MKGVWVDKPRATLEVREMGKNVPIPLQPFSQSLMVGRACPEVQLQFGRGNGFIGSSDLICKVSDTGSVLGGWLYDLSDVAINIRYSQEGKWGG